MFDDSLVTSGRVFKTGARSHGSVERAQEPKSKKVKNNRAIVVSFI